MSDTANQKVEDAIASGARGALATLLGMAGNVFHDDANDELAAVVRHQLSSPLKVELATLGSAAAEMAEAAVVRPGQRFATFGDVFRDDSPPVELLMMIKDYARMGKKQNQAMPSDVWNVLYFAAIAAAQSRCGTRITQLAEREIIEGVRWVLAIPSLDAEFRQKVALDLQRIVQLTES